MKHPSPDPIDDRTIVLDSGKTRMSDPGRRGKGGISGSSPSPDRTRGFFSLFIRKRRLVDTRIEELKDRKTPQNVLFSGQEQKLDFLENEYELKTELARGGQGTLFLGIDKKLRRQVAIKSLRPEQCEDLRQRSLFLNEARVTAQLDHPAIVPVYTLNSDRKNGLHLAMKRINGVTLKAYLDQVSMHYRLDGVDSFDEAKALQNRLEIFLKICDALEYAHSRNVMHCDLKPANIMIGEYHEAYIMDWGIARPIQAWETRRTLVGTPQYLAPEAIVGEPCDQRADIFAMGAILFEMVMLKNAFTGNTPEEVMTRIRDGLQETPEHRFGVPVSRDLKAILRKAMAADPEKRYSKISELSSDLRRYLAGYEVSVRPDGPLMRIARWSYRHRKTSLILLLLALLTGLGALAHSFYQSYRFSEAMRERDLALSAAYSICTRAAYQLDEQFLKLEHMTSLLAADVQYLLRNDLFLAPPKELKYRSVDEMRRIHLPGMLYSSFHRGIIDPTILVYNLTNDTDRTTLTRRLDPLSRFLPRLLQVLLVSPRNAQIRPDRVEAMKKEAFSSGTPAIRILFAFHDGLYAAFPASGAFPLQYDPRTRLWYQVVLRQEKKNFPVWTAPYIDSIPEIGLVISCSTPFYREDGSLNGVCALDISLPKLIQELKSSGNTGTAVEEKAIIDNSGQIIVSTTRSFAEARMRRYRSSDEPLLFAALPDPTLLDTMKKQRYGVIFREENGAEYVYAFCHIRSVGWFYLEKMNLLSLMREFDQ